MSALIDTTEMYLRTIFELEEEGIAPMRARITERLHQSGPTVSQTVARMERDGLVVVAADRQLEFTPLGREAAIRVMRKHRLAECLLVSVLGLPWEDVHAEACRWEHVISEPVEQRLLAILGNPTHSPYGNPIPGLDSLDPGSPHDVLSDGELRPLSEVVTDTAARVTVRRIAEPIQESAVTMAALQRVGAMPGAAVMVARTGALITIGSAGEYTELNDELAQHVLVQTAS
ncbi:MAG: iron dependent repressor, metal binding and dimerization domain protein [Candidatus Nanopelagicales bacterium]|nr:iron dependent repressor, metal binding and dimerization domain protein [Candidatus Nanopelagicales bacterium]